MSKVLLVTDYSGGLHITPVGNENYYKAQNLRNRNQQYKMKEMDEDAANKFVADNLGIDPHFKSPAQTNQVIEDKDKEIRELRAQLLELKKDNGELEKQKALLNQLSTASTSNNDYSNAAAQGGQAGHDADQDKPGTVKAADLIAKINEAKTEDELKSLVPETETRATVVAARDKKLEEIKK